MQELERIESLLDHLRGAGCPSFVEELGCREPGEHDDPGLGCDLQDPRKGFQPIHAGHRDVEEDEVGLVVSSGGDRLPPVIGLAQHGEAR
jgi:hypothetical protein